jgi:wyosine [tRNA(Phe)-imidazoG37] synthetase (radical SAM superfamily)
MSHKKKSKGLLATLEENQNSAVYQPLSMDAFANTLKSFMEDVPKKKKPRIFVLHTGLEGAKAFNEETAKQAEKQLLIQTVDELYAKGLIELHQEQMILEGLNSENEEIYEFSKKLLDAVVLKYDESAKKNR